MDCPSVPVMDGIEFRLRFFDKLRGKRIPFTGQMEITERCNLRCHHCYIVDNTSKGELTLPEIRRIIDEVADAGCLWFVITGGEPLVRPDFLDIYTYAKKKGMFVVLFTNATLINERIADYFAELPPYTVDISIYGITEETYERVVGVPGAYRRCLNGIQLLQDRHVPLGLKTVSVKANQHEVLDIEKFAESVGSSFRYDAMINPRIDGGMGPCVTRLSPEEIVAQDLADPKRIKALRFMYDLSLNWERSDEVFDCGAGKNTFAVSARGQVHPCGLARQVGFDLRHGSFHDAWRNYFPKTVNAKREKPSRCDNCKLFILCGMCPSWAELENSGEDRPVDFICRVAHLRAKALAQIPAAPLEEKQAVAVSG